MTKKNYLQDLNEIKTIMNKSSRFLSLSGLSGILSGVYAIIGASIAYYLVKINGNAVIIIDSKIFKICVLILFIVALLSIFTGVYLSLKKAKKTGEKVWNASSKRLIINFLIPLIVGGVYILIILGQQKYGQTSALMLIFYGLALVNASKYSIGTIRYLGYIEIILGLTSEYFPGYGFWMWVLGFGVMHIIYGIFMHFKYDS